MRFHTKRYDVEKYEEGNDFDSTTYEVSLKEGYMFDDGSHLNYACDIEDLRSLIAEIIPETN